MGGERQPEVPKGKAERLDEVKQVAEVKLPPGDHLPHGTPGTDQKGYVPPVELHDGSAITTAAADIGRKCGEAFGSTVSPGDKNWKQFAEGQLAAGATLLSAIHGASSREQLTAIAGLVHGRAAELNATGALLSALHNQVATLGEQALKNRTTTA
jgi:hypothetical protein